MNSIFGIAQSGLQMAQQRLAVSANNVARMESGPRQVLEEVAAQEAFPAGASGSSMPNHDPLTSARLDQTLTSLSQTDLVQESVNQTLAANLFRANLATIRTADENLGTLMNVVG